jgi:preprotein translocase subunit SecE
MGFLSRIGEGFKRTGNFFKDSWQELKKVRWPNRKELTSYTIVVIVTVVVVALYLYVIDLGLTQLVELIMG